MSLDGSCRTLVLMKQHAQCLDGVLAGSVVALLLGPLAFGLGLSFMRIAVGRRLPRTAIASVAAIGVVAIASLTLAMALNFYRRQDQAIEVIVSAVTLSVPIQTVLAVTSLLIVALRRPHP